MQHDKANGILRYIESLKDDLRDEIEVTKKTGTVIATGTYAYFHNLKSCKKQIDASLNNLTLVSQEREGANI